MNFNKCSSKESLGILQCGHSFCMHCKYDGKCLLDSQVIDDKDILSFFNQNEYEGEKYTKRIYKIQEHVLQLSRGYRYHDDYFKIYKNEIKNALGELVEKTTPNITFMEYLQLFKERFLVYEIFDYLNRRSKVEIVNILIYYPVSQLCFVYKAKNHYHPMLFGFYFEKIIRNIGKEELENLFFNRQLEQERIVQNIQEPYRISNLMNPGGFVDFPEKMENFFEKYVNQTNKPYSKLNLKFFRNYLWIHYQQMLPIEKENLKKIIFRNFLRKKTNLQNEIVDYILSFV
jgi:hypothetical protein